MIREHEIELLLQDQAIMRNHLLEANQALHNALNKLTADNRALLLQVNRLQDEKVAMAKNFETAHDIQIKELEAEINEYKKLYNIGVK